MAPGSRPILTYPEFCWANLDSWTPIVKLFARKTAEVGPWVDAFPSHCSYLLHSIVLFLLVYHERIILPRQSCRKYYYYYYYDDDGGDDDDDGDDHHYDHHHLHDLKSLLQARRPDPHAMTQNKLLDARKREYLEFLGMLPRGFRDENLKWPELGWTFSFSKRIMVYL